MDVHYPLVLFFLFLEISYGTMLSRFLLMVDMGRKKDVG
jgi:hypothetical protein